MSEVNKIGNYKQMMSWLTRPSVPKTETREDFAIGGGNFYGTDLGTREGFQDIIPGMKYDNLPESTKNKIIELGKTKPTAEIARDLQNELPPADNLNSLSRTIKNFLRKRNIEPLEQLGGSSMTVEERLAKEKIITDFIKKNPDITNADAISKSINASNSNLNMSPNFVKSSFKRLGLDDVLTSRHAEIFPQIEKLDKILKKNKKLLNGNLASEVKKNKILEIYAKETNQSLDEAAANLKSRLAKLGKLYAGEEQRYEKKLYSKIKAPTNYMDSSFHKNLISIADRAGIISNIDMARLLGLPKKQIDLIQGTANMMNAFDFKVAGDHTDIKALMKNFPNYKKNFTRIEYIKDNLNEYKRGYDRKILSLSKQAKGASPSVQQDLLKKQQVLQNEFANKTGYKLGGFDIKKGRVTINPQTLRLPDLKNPYNDTLQTAMKNFVKTGLPGETGTTFSQIDQRLINSTPEERIKIFEEIQGTTEAKKSQYLKALQKIPKIGKIATAVVGGTAGAVGVSTLANASETVDVIPVKKEKPKEGTTEGGSAAVAGGATLFGKYLPQILKGTVKTVGSAPSALTFAGMTVKEGMDEGKTFADAVTEPLVGAELLYPELFKRAGLGFNALNKLARVTSPAGVAITGGGILKNVITDSEPNLLIDRETGEPKTFEREDASFVMPTMLDMNERAYKLSKEKGISYSEAFKELAGDKTFKEGIESLKEKYAIGGRVGFADGPEDPNKRKFMKIMGGLASLPILGRFFDVATQAPKVAEAVAGVPQHFTKLYDKIKLEGFEIASYAERIKQYIKPSKDGKSELMLTEDLGTGDIQIKKIYPEDENMNTKVEQMNFSKGQADEATKGTPADEYEEVTEINSRIQKDEYNDPDYEDGIDVEDIMKEIDD